MNTQDIKFAPIYVHNPKFHAGNLQEPNFMLLDQYNNEIAPIFNDAYTVLNFCRAMCYEQKPFNYGRKFYELLLLCAVNFKIDRIVADYIQKPLNTLGYDLESLRKYDLSHEVDLKPGLSYNKVQYKSFSDYLKINKVGEDKKQRAKIAKAIADHCCTSPLGYYYYNGAYSLKDDCVRWLESDVHPNLRLGVLKTTGTSVALVKSNLEGDESVFGGDFIITKGPNY